MSEYELYRPNCLGPVRDCANVEEIASQRPKLAPRIHTPVSDMSEGSTESADESLVGRVNRQLREG